MSYSFAWGEKGSVTFSQKENGHLLLSALVKGQAYEMEFVDSMTFANHNLNRNETAYTRDIYSAATTFEAGENTLLAICPVDQGVVVYNRFTADENYCAVRVETWVEAENRVYDCTFIPCRTKMDTAGFTEITGRGFEDRTFPINPAPPTYGFRGVMTLLGENRYLQIHGGHMWQYQGLIDAHLQAFSYNDDLTIFSKDDPFRTVYAFEPGVEFVQAKPPVGKEVATGAIVSGDLEVAYTQKAEGAGFLCRGNAYAMAAMLVRECDTKKYHHIDTLRGWNKVSVNGGEFLFADHKELPGIGMRLVAETDGKGKVEWSVEAINENENLSLIWCTYIRGCQEVEGLQDLFVPFGGGCVEEGINVADGFRGGQYPSGLSFAMPYFAAYETGGGKGIYYGIHAGDGGMKEMHSCAAPGGDRMHFSCIYCAPNLAEPANGFKLPGKTVWQAFHGDWFDAAEIYREFVEKHCDWLPATTENGRENIPEWFKDIPFWVMDWIPNETEYEEPIPVNLRPTSDSYGPDYWYDTPIRLKEALGTPMGYHLYNWHGNPFNNDFPHYFPVKKALSVGLPKLKEAGIRVMPYTNALLWDTLDHHGEDYQFSTLGLPGATKRESGKPAILTYASHEPNGELCKLAPMCPSTRVWRDKVKEFVMKLLTEYGMDGVYLDQIGAHAPQPCMDKSHPHAPGGGGWWQKAYREMLREINAEKPEGTILTTECNAEPFTDSLDGFLSWSWISVGKYVPAFMRIYGGRIVVFGRNANGYMKDDVTYWRYHLAQSLVGGEQLGWINSDFVDIPEKLEFAKGLVRFRYENRAFFRGARAMRTPVVECDESHKFVSGIGMMWQAVLHEPLLCVGALENGSKKMLIAVNLSDEEMTDSVRFVAEEFGLTAENFACMGDGAAVLTGENHLQMTVPGGKVLAIAWEA